MARRKRKTLLHLEPENFGHRIRRAYNTQRNVLGYTYSDIQDRITNSKVMKISDTQLQRLERHEGVPPTSQTRLQAYVALVAYGYDPADFGLDEKNVNLGVIDLDKLYEKVAPKGPKTSNIRGRGARKTAADLRKPTSGCSEVPAA